MIILTRVSPENALRTAANIPEFTVKRKTLKCNKLEIF